MTDDIYEVEKEEYLSFCQTLNPHSYTETQNQIDDWHYEITETSNLTNKILCKKIVTLDLKKNMSQINATILLIYLRRKKAMNLLVKCI